MLTWKHWAWVTALAVAVELSMVLHTFDTDLYWTQSRILFHTPWMIFFAYAFLFAIALAEACVPDGTMPSTGRYITAVFVASTVCLVIAAIGSDQIRFAPKLMVVGKPWSAGQPPPLSSAQKRVHAVLQLAGDAVFHGWLLAFIYVGLRKSRLAAKTLADAQVEGAEVKRRLLASQLEAARAQVDPADVFESLESIERTYELDPAKADAQLNELIAFLRAAIPRLRSNEIGRDSA